MSASAPLGWWRLDDDLASPVASDEVGSYPGTYGGSRELVDGALDGTNDAVRFGSASEVISLPGDQIAPSSITVEVWVKPESTGGTVQRLARHRTYGFNLDWLRDVGTFSGGVNLADGSGAYWGAASLVPDASFTPGEWHHVVMTVEPGLAVLFVDGVEHDRFVAAGTTGVYYEGTLLTIGNDSPGYSSRDFTGSLDELALYDRALSSAEVVDHYEATGRTVVPPPPIFDGEYDDAVLASAPVAYWPLDESTNILTADEAVGSLDGTYSSYNLQWEQPGAYPGSTAIGFNHRQEIVTLPGASIQPGEITVEMWIKPASGAMHIQRAIRHRNHGYAIDWNGTAQTFSAWAFVGTSGQSVSLTSSPVSADEWHHVVLTIDADSAVLVVDGEVHAQQTNPAGANVHYSGSGLVLGNDYYNYSSRYLVGQIDDVAIYDRALPVAEIIEHVEAAGALVSVSPDIDAVVTCSSNGGNLFFEVPTYVASEDAFLDGCYYVESCVSDLWSVVGAIAEWSCDNQDTLIQILDTVGVPAEILHNVTNELAGALAAVAFVAAPSTPTPLFPPETAPLVEETGPGATGGPSWTARATGALVISEIAYQTTEFVDTPDRVRDALLLDLQLLERVADNVRATPGLATIDADRQRRTAAMTCIETIAIDQVAAAIGQTLDATGFNTNGQHACELIPVLFPGSSWTTQSGLVRDTTPSTQLDADAIANQGSPMVLSRLVGGHGTWYTSYCTSGPGDECDEYPFNSSNQGGPVNYASGTVELRPVPAESNQGEGNALTSFYGSTNGCGISDGDFFGVVPMPTPDAPGTTWACP